MRCPLDELYLARCHRVTDTALAALGDFCAGLAELHVAGCARLTDWGVKVCPPQNADARRGPSHNPAPPGVPRVMIAPKDTT